MNASLLAKFTPDILRGAQRCGLDRAALSAALKLPGREVDALLKGSKRLTQEQAARIVQQCGQTIGQLAVLGIEQDASPQRRKEAKKLIRDTLELMATLDDIDPAAPAATAIRRRSLVR